jgi:hypothetical protein
MLANTLARRVPLNSLPRALSTWSAVPAGPPDPILGASHIKIKFIYEEGTLS